LRKLNFGEILNRLPFPPRAIVYFLSNPHQYIKLDRQGVYI
jgi:hypothetical protein